MTLQPGTMVGHYEVLSSVGAGGMGEVYRASDPRLGRDVAIKVITAALSQDRDAVARFEREARAAASLNHPSILGVFDVGTIDGAPFIVTELLDGVTLRERLRSGGLPVRRVLEWTSQIADALAAVHSRGVVHRDLKPGNIFITNDGRVKVLDFGLAKLIATDAADATKTYDAAHTATGIVVGTTAYMSPEQALGKPVDHRSDIFSLGLVAYEMLTGQRPFQRDTALATMSAIAEDDAAPPSSLVPGIPPIVDQIVLRCLEKRPDARFQSASDLAFALSSVSLSSAQLGSLPVSRGPRSRAGVAASVVAVAAVSLAAGAAGLWWAESARPVRPTTPKHFVIDLTRTPLSEDLLPVAISPDGGTLAFSTGSYEGRQLAVRQLRDLDATLLSGTLGAREPFFSPDGRWIAFRADGELRKIPVTGGPVVKLAAAGEGMGVASSMGGSWGTDGHIYYSYAARLWRVAESGGAPDLIAAPEITRGEGLYEWPQILPGNNTLLFTIVTSTPVASSRVSAIPIGGGLPRTLVEGAAYGRYLFSGHLFYVQGSTAFVAPFDPRTLVVSGPPVAVLEGIRIGAGASAVFAAAEDGTIVYLEGVARLQHTLVWVDRTGRATAIDAPARQLEFPRLSPDGTQIAIAVRDGTTSDIWIDDSRKGGTSRLTLEGGIQSPPLWTPDGQSLLFARRLKDGPSEIVQHPIEPGRTPAVLLRRPESLWPASWSADGRQLAFMRGSTTSSDGNIETMQPGSGAEPHPVVNTPATEWGGVLSPDGRWMAYVSSGSGRWEVYLTPFPGPGMPRQVSVDGGSEAVWRRDGRELFYRNGTKLFGVPLTPGSPLTVGAPRVLFEGTFVPGQPGLPNYDVSLDGERFLMVQPDPHELSIQPLHVIVNWFDHLGSVTASTR